MTSADEKLHNARPWGGSSAQVSQVHKIHKIHKIPTSRLRYSTHDI